MFTLPSLRDDDDLVVLTPAIGPGIPWTLVLAFSMWIASELREFGLAAGFEAVLSPRSDGKPGYTVHTCQEWPPEMVRKYLASIGNRRYAITLKMAAEGTRCRAEVDLHELVEPKRLRRVREWRYAGQNHEVFSFFDQVIDEALKELGHPGIPAPWHERLDQWEGSVCIYYLMALERLIFSGLNPEAEAAPIIESVMKTIRESPGWSRGVDLVEHLMVVLIRQFDTTDLQLQRILNRAREANGGNDPSWKNVIARARALATPPITPAANDVLN